MPLDIHSIRINDPASLKFPPASGTIQPGASNKTNKGVDSYQLVDKTLLDFAPVRPIAHPILLAQNGPGGFGDGSDPNLGIRAVNYSDCGAA